MTHCTFIFRSFFTGKFAGLTSRSSWHSVQMVLLSHHRRGIFFSFFFPWLVWKPGVQSVRFLPRHLREKCIFLSRSWPYLLQEREWFWEVWENTPCVKFLSSQEANIEELKIWICSCIFLMLESYKNTKEEKESDVNYKGFSKWLQAAMSQCKPMALATSLKGFCTTAAFIVI